MDILMEKTTQKWITGKRECLQLILMLFQRAPLPQQSRGFENGITHIKKASRGNLRLGWRHDNQRIGE